MANLCQFLMCCCCVLLAVLNAESLNYERIINGDAVGPAKRTYNVYVKIGSFGSCGGAIISSRHVLTAAHCLIDERGRPRSNAIKIVAGSNDLLDIKAKNKVQIDVVKYYVFKDVFEELRKLYLEISTDIKDIALLKLKSKLDTKNNRYISELQLPGALNYESAKATVTGFGAIGIKFESAKGPQPIYDGKLYELEVNISSEEENCLKPFIRQINLTNRNQFICVDIRNKSASTCKSDSGSPLVYQENVLLGILAFGAPFCNVPQAMFVRISSFEDFIRKAMKDKVDKSMHCECLTANATCLVQ